MVSCVILYHSTVTSLTKCKMLRAMFYEDEFEIHVIQANAVAIYLWNVDKIRIYQAVIDFETASVATFFGFGKNMEDAYMKAKDVFDFVLYGNTSINEKRETYEVC